MLKQSFLSLISRVQWLYKVFTLEASSRVHREEGWREFTCLYRWMYAASCGEEKRQQWGKKFPRSSKLLFGTLITDNNWRLKLKATLCEVYDYKATTSRSKGQWSCQWRESGVPTCLTWRQYSFRYTSQDLNGFLYLGVSECVLSSQQRGNATASRSVRQRAGLSAENPTAMVRRTVSLLRSGSIKKIFLVNHSAMLLDLDTANNTSNEVAEHVQNIYMNWKTPTDRTQCRGVIFKAFFLMLHINTCGFNVAAFFEMTASEG